MGVKYPEMRARLIDLLRDSHDAQAEDEMVGDIGRFNDWFNDLDWLTEKPSESVGVLFLNGREAEAVGSFRQVLDSMYVDLGDVDFSSYRGDPRWASLQEAARQALMLLAPESV